VIAFQEKKASEPANGPTDPMDRELSIDELDFVVGTGFMGIPFVSRWMGGSSSGRGSSGRW
jgi:hypothetical protein